MGVYGGDAVLFQSLNLGTRRSWVVSRTPPLHCQRKVSCTHQAGCCMGLTANL